MKQRVVLDNPRRDPINDLIAMGAIVGLAFIGVKLLVNRGTGALYTTTVRDAAGSGIVYDSGSKSLVGVNAGDIVTDKYGNRFRVLPGGREVEDISTGIKYSSSILQTKYDVQE
ncbi:MAG: hypothetical protein GXX85_17935 [Ignavibacteria bacterium]|nr:hypothetical protein [Ignavibacteria bacterium]